jgi:hypothetical protein
MISDEIKTLYRVFSRYPRPSQLEGCPCCTDAETSRFLASKPLHTLTATELSHYAFKALSTWGTLDDFRYFLPRILELTALEQLDCDTEVTLGKLGYANWTDWPADEQKAVWEYVAAFWVQSIRSDDICQADAVLCGFSLSSSDISLLLTTADALAPDFRSAYRNECGRCDKQRLTNSFWERSMPSYQQALDWAYSTVNLRGEQGADGKHH